METIKDQSEPSQTIWFNGEQSWNLPRQLMKIYRLEIDLLLRGQVRSLRTLERSICHIIKEIKNSPSGGMPIYNESSAKNILNNSDDEVNENDPCEKNLVATPHLGNGSWNHGYDKILNYRNSLSLFDTV